jgi:hypothetical protein
MKNILALFVLILLQLNVYAQGTYTVSGTVKNAKGELLSGATVFLAGSEKATSSNLEGRFWFSKIESGTYQLVVNLLGYSSVKQNIIITDKSEENVEVVLGEKQIVLNEVIIGDAKQRKNHIKTFTKYFLGESANAKACKILNPETLEFSTTKNVLKATTPDFLVIQNNNLGYKIKYLLKSFSYDSSLEVTLYDGDCIFEQLEGTPEQRLLWTKNRKVAYNGSLMHYLRSVYANKSRQEGFLIYKITSPSFPIYIESIPIIAEQLVKRPDSNFMIFRSQSRFYILYDKKKAAKEDKLLGHVQNLRVSDLDNTGSIFLVDSQIDRRGSYADYKSLLIQGFWGRKRLADQLPLEYSPL